MKSELGLKWERSPSVATCRLQNAYYHEMSAKVGANTSIPD